MADRYHRLTLQQREEISRLLAQAYSLRAIAGCLGIHPSTISREVSRAGGRDRYRAVPAQLQAQAHRQRLRPRRLDNQPRLRSYVLKSLRRYWSPQQISSRLATDYPNDESMRISAEAIYTYIYVLPRGELKSELIHCLRQQRSRRGRYKRLRVHRSPKITDMLSIEERPGEVADRSVPGHWEGDLIMGSLNQSALGTLVERTSRYLLLVPVAGRSAALVREAVSAAVLTIPRQLRVSLTHDQGSEMAQHRLFSESTQVLVYFAHPHSPWERGTNENTNGLIRQFFPKGTNFNNTDPDQVQHVQDLLNGRPRKTLDYQTPDEVFAKLLASVALGG